MTCVIMTAPLSRVIVIIIIIIIIITQQEMYAGSDVAWKYKVRDAK